LLKPPRSLWVLAKDAQFLKPAGGEILFVVPLRFSTNRSPLYHKGAE
jgi:hypothetical protein